MAASRIRRRPNRSDSTPPNPQNRALTNAIKIQGERLTAPVLAGTGVEGAVAVTGSPERCNDRDPLGTPELPTVGIVDNRSEIRDFMVSRRARIGPEQAGLSSRGIRRVPGLRRSEVAALAGVSLEHYTRLERGDLAGASDSVLDAVARALRLDDAERAHLGDLARNCRSAPRRPRRKRHAAALRPNLQRTLDALTGAPAFVLNGRADLMAANTLGRALFAPLYEVPTGPTTLGSCSWIPVPNSSGPTGRGSPTTPSRCCTCKPLVSRMTRP